MEAMYGYSNARLEESSASPPTSFPLSETPATGFESPNCNPKAKEVVLMDESRSTGTSETKLLGVVSL